jgi:hypothetical protein
VLLETHIASAQATVRTFHRLNMYPSRGNVVQARRTPAPGNCAGH